MITCRFIILITFNYIYSYANIASLNFTLGIYHIVTYGI